MTLKAKLLTLVACLSLTSVLMAQTPAPVTLTIVHFNDVYEISPVEGGKSGGLARVATRIKQLPPHVRACIREVDVIVSPQGAVRSVIRFWDKPKALALAAHELLHLCRRTAHHVEVHLGHAPGHIRQLEHIRDRP